MLDYKKLKEIGDEIILLSKINFKDEIKHFQKAHKILRKLENFAENEDEKRFLIKLIDKFIKQNNTNDVSKSIEAYIKSVEFNKINSTAREQILNFQSVILGLKNSGLSLSAVSLKNCISSVNKLRNLLKEQRDIVCKYIQEINNKERQKLYDRFLKNESKIYKIYTDMPNLLSLKIGGLDIVKENSQKHMFGAMWNDFFSVIKWIENNLSTTFWICVFLGACFCMPYFLNINKFPDIDINNIAYLFLFVAGLAFLQIAIILFFIVIYNYAIFKNNVKNKITKFIFALMQLSMLIILILPFIYKFDYLKAIVDYLLNNFNWLVSAYFLLFVIYFGFGAFKNKNLTNPFIWFALFFALSFDFLFICFVYIRYEEINFFLFLVAFYFFIIVKAFAFSKTFDYKIVFAFSLFMAILPIILLSPNFVKIINLANYEESYTIKTEFIPKIVLNLPTCFEGYGGSCIENTDANKTKINNLLVKVKSEDRYYFEILIKDTNITKENFANAIRYVADKNLTKMPPEGNFTIEDFKSIFSKTKEFTIHKRNIEN